MRILTIHNKYKFRGGEDESRESEDRLLMERGHEIRQIVFDNATIQISKAVPVGIQATWCPSSYQRVCREIRAWRPDVLDIHNFFPLASPAVHYAGLRHHVPVVQTLHNYRLLCPGANFFRNGVICEDCTMHRVPWPALQRKCYRASSLQTAAVAIMDILHRSLRTWNRAVSLFIALSEFEKRKFVENGFPEARIVVKPNFVPDPGPPGRGGDRLLFVGRLSPEKGVRTLLRAMAATAWNIQLKIVGEGPLEPEVRAAAAHDPRIEYLGKRVHREVLDLMASARCLVFPSECYETFGRVAAEAFSRGTPVIAARLGAVAEIVDEGRTGLHFTSADPADLVRAMKWVYSNPEKVAAMRREARAEYEARFTSERNYHLLIETYEKAIAVGQVLSRGALSARTLRPPFPSHECAPHL